MPLIGVLVPARLAEDVDGLVARVTDAPGQGDGALSVPGR